jgi:hypothetical protein
MDVVIGVDVGHTNMAVAVCMAEDGIDSFTVLFFEKYDLNFYEGSLYERVNRFFEAVILPLLNYHQQCTVAIEIQPPTGLTNVECILLTRLMDHNVVRVHPKSFHVFLKITHLDYEGRKEKVTQLADVLITNDILKYKFGNMWRKHDVADSILFCYYVLSSSHKQPTPAPQVAQDLERFRFLPQHSRLGFGPRHPLQLRQQNAQTRNGTMIHTQPSV